jgi:hypothetical protein
MNFVTPRMVERRLKTARRIAQAQGRKLLDNGDYCLAQADKALVSALHEKVNRLRTLAQAFHHAGVRLCDAADADLNISTPNSTQETDA